MLINYMDLRLFFYVTFLDRALELICSEAACKSILTLTGRSEEIGNVFSVNFISLDSFLGTFFN